MPPLPPAPLAYKITFKSTIAEDLDVINSLHFGAVGGPISIATAFEIATDCAAGWAANMMGLFESTTEFQECIVQDLTVADGVSSTASLPTPGAGASGNLPASACMILRFGVARRYRGGHPKMYLSGLSAGNLHDPQTWLVASTTDALASLANLIAAIGTSFALHGLTEQEHVNVSYFSGFTNFLEHSGRYRAIPTLRGVPLVEPILTYSVNARVASQRRRNEQSGA